jgi:hypothetical protein
LHMDPAQVRELGFKILRHWSDVEAVTEKDAFALTKRQQMLTEQHDQQHREMVEAQQSWHSGREQSFHAAYAKELAGRMGGEAHAEAREAGLRAMLEFERRNPCETIGIPTAARTDESLVELQVADASRWGPVAGELVS